MNTQYLGDAYMDGLYGTDDDPVEGKNTRPHGRLTVTDPDGYWILDTNSEDTAKQHVVRFGGTIKPYDGKDRYR